MPPKPTGWSIRTRQARGEFSTGGGLVQMLHNLPPEVSLWLLNSIPEDASLSELLQAIIVDVYHEEHPPT